MNKNYFFLISFFIIFLDQLIKVIVHLNMPLHSEINLIGNFFKLHHLENPGLAFGIDLNFKYGKLLLTSFRFFASLIIGYYLFPIEIDLAIIQVYFQQTRNSFLFCLLACFPFIFSCIIKI